MPIVVVFCAVDELKFNDHELRLKRFFFRSNLFVLMFHFNKYCDYFASNALKKMSLKTIFVLLLFLVICGYLYLVLIIIYSVLV